jgi:hypothetical protein
MSKQINDKLVCNLLSVVDKGLSHGLGIAKPGHMCVEAAVCYALGENHSDDPSCVAHVVRDTKIYLNDRKWSSKKARARGMRKIAVAQLGSKGKIERIPFLQSLGKVIMKKIIQPRLVKAGYIEEAEKIKNAKILRGVTLDKIGQKISDDDEEIYNAFDLCNNLIQENRSFYSASDIESLIDEIRYIDSVSYSTKKADKILCEFADAILETLIKLRSPGTKYLHLCKD